MFGNYPGQKGYNPRYGSGASYSKNPKGRRNKNGGINLLD